MNINILNDHCRVLNFDIHNNQDHTTINLTMLKENYRILALKYHPDHNFDSVESTEQFKIIHASYEILIDHISKNGTIITPTTTVYDTIEIDDMDYDEDDLILHCNGGLLKNKFFRQQIVKALQFDFKSVTWAFSDLSASYGSALIAAELHEVPLLLQDIVLKSKLNV